MSSHSAIAAVTATLHLRLRKALEVTGLNADVSHTRPGTINALGTKVGVHLFLYMVTPHAALRNADLPMRDDQGRISNRPTAALELHYLLSFFGEDLVHEPQRMLGAIAAELHAHPVLTPAEISAATSDPPLAGSRLEQQIERVRLTPEAINLEEFSKLWSVLFQTQYLLSVAYKASVVLLEADVAVPVPGRVRARGVWSASLPPTIASLAPQILGAGGRALVRGSGFQGGSTFVRFVQEDGSVTQVVPIVLDSDRLEVGLPEDLRAGIVAAQVVTRPQARSGTLPARSFELESGQVPFMLAPRIVQDAQLETLDEVVAALGTSVVVEVVPAIGADQRVHVLLGSLRLQPTWTTPADGPSAVEFTIPADAGLVVGEVYPLRIEVDRAVSLVEDDASGFKPRFIVGGP